MEKDKGMTQPQQQLQKHQHTQVVEMVLVLVNHQQLQLQKIVKKQAHQKMVEVANHFFQVLVKL